ncbi:hypothetical protein GCM10008967_11840 [Bacillus carboniphilus]|uniref:Uncharacterized protein n=1 Tax=Bacillus carboniphilus TaxID=86663 RepID=A0ABN0W1T7_9BACI
MKKKRINRDQNQLEEEISKIEKQIAAAVWLQAIGQTVEAILLLKLLMLKEESEGEIKVATGVWIQTIGQILEALGVTKEITALDKNVLTEAQKIVITGDLLQSVGAAVETIGGKEILVENTDGFIP